MKMLQAQPALPVQDIARAVSFYQDKAGFSLTHQDDGFAILRRGSHPDQSPGFESRGASALSMPVF